MKKLIAILALVPSFAFGSLIDLTPGGYTVTPKIVADWYANTRPGVVLFPEDSPLFTVTGLGTPTITLSWNLTHIGIFEWVFVHGGLPISVENFYQVPQSQWTMGEALLITDGVTPITGLTLFGKYDAPEAGSSTIALFLIGLASLYASSHHRFKSF